MSQQQAPATGTVVFFVAAKIFELVGLVIKSATNLGFAYIGYLSVVELAGKTTVANFALTYITGHEGRFRLLPWVITVIATIWAYTERHLRLKKIAAMATHNAELERRLDAGRSSSMLTIEGETAPGDKNI